MATKRKKAATPKKKRSVKPKETVVAVTSFNDGLSGGGVRAKQKAATEKALSTLITTKSGEVVSVSALRKEFVQRWRDEEKAMSAVIVCVLNMGRILVEANPKTKGPKALPHGEFEAMVREDFKMDPATARKFMIIANHSVISNRAHVHDLPPSWGTLYELTKVPVPRLEAKIKDGTVNANMERKDVKPLLPAQNSKKKKYETNDDPEEEMPTQEEADESYQDTLYDHACLIVDERMSGETRQRFFAYLRSNYNVEVEQSQAQRERQGLPA